MGVSLKRLGDVTSEFFSALRDGETYSVTGNSYLLFGLLWGIPVPLLGLMVANLYAGSAPGATPSSFLREPLFLFLALHPPVFAVVFGAMGTIRLRKMARIADLLAEREREMRGLQEAHEALQELTRLKDEFLGNVTHELKTPLVTIRGYAEMLAHGRLGAVSEPQVQALTVMQRNCSRLQQQIELLLAASRNQSPALGLVPSAIPLREMVMELMDRHRPKALQKQITIACEPPDAGITLWGDYGRLTEVFDNLLGNALKFTEAGGAVSLAFGAPRDNRLSATIADSGCGIAPEAQRFIFERFRQADGSIRRRYGGSGLGLALVRENLAAHGCTIAVDSAPGQGARFTFDLPLRTATDTIPPAREENSHAHAA